MQDLANGHLDVKALGEAANGDENTIVTTRTGNTYPSAERAINIMFKNGGLPATPFATKALMTASALVDGDYAQVTDDTVNNGLYIKTAGAWVKSGYDPVNQAKSYTKNKSDIRIFGIVPSNIKYKTVSRELEFSGTVYRKSLDVYNTIRTPQILSLPTNGFYKIEYNDETGNLRASTNQQAASEDWLVVAIVLVSDTGIVAPDFVSYHVDDKEWVAASEANTNTLASAKLYTDNIVASSELASKSYTRVKLKEFSSSFLKPSINLIDISKFTLNKAIDETTGNIVDNTKYAYSDLISVEPDTDYTLSSTTRTAQFMAYYDELGVFISRVEVTLGASLVMTIKTLPNAFYVRFILMKEDLGAKEHMFKKGLEVVPYEPALDPMLVNVRLPTDDYIKKSNNLFNPATVTNNKVISVTGEYVDAPNNNWGVSDYISVSPNTEYTISGDEGVVIFANASFFDADKVFINRIESYDLEFLGPITITTPSNSHFVRLNISTGDPANYHRMFNKGSTALPYEPYGATLTGLELGEDIISKLPSTGGGVTTPFRYDMPINQVFSAPKSYSEYSAITLMDTAGVYGEWDALMAASNGYITKHPLGMSTGGHEMAYYKLTAQRHKNDLSKNGLEDKYPTIFITCATHGHEPVSVFTMFALASELTNNWKSSEGLEALRFNSDIIVIPVTNPSAWELRTRKSASGVDVNRNAPSAGWFGGDPDSKTYGGPSPASEPETQYVMQVLAENDVNIYYDFHNFGYDGSPTETEWFIWVVAPISIQLRMERLARGLFGRMSRKWKKDYVWLDDNWSAGYSDANAEGMLGNYAAETGVQLSGTLELSLNWKQLLGTGAERWDEIHSKTLVEGTVNWLLMNLEELRNL